MEILKELRALNDNVDEFHEYFERVIRQQKKRRISNGILNGVLNAVGVVFGTVLITGLLVYAGQALVRSQGFQDWARATFQEAVSDAIQNEIQDLAN